MSLGDLYRDLASKMRENDEEPTALILDEYAADADFYDESGVSSATRCSREHPCDHFDPLHIILWGQCFIARPTRGA